MHRFRVFCLCLAFALVTMVKAQQPTCDGRSKTCTSGLLFYISYVDYGMYCRNYIQGTPSVIYLGHDSNGTTTPLGLQQSDSCGTMWYITKNADGTYRYVSQTGTNGNCAEKRVILGNCNPPNNG